MVRRPTNTSFKYISVALWFPPGDETAAHLARLCALREDLYIEFQGLHGEPLTPLDECSDGYRRTYFFRNQLRTLSEIVSAVHMISSDRKLMTEVYKQHPEIKSEFARIRKRLGGAHAKILRARDDVGGHLLQTAVLEGITKIPPDTKGMLQTGDSPNAIHYRFTLEILGATMLRHVSLSSAKEEWENFFDEMISLGFDALHFVDILFRAYGLAKNLPFA